MQYIIHALYCNLLEKKQDNKKGQTNLVPIPKLHIGRTACSLILFQRWLYKNDVKFTIQLFQIIRQQVCF